jgi:hypothetical protein
VLEVVVAAAVVVVVVVEDGDYTETAERASYFLECSAE